MVYLIQGDGFKPQKTQREKDERSKPKEGI